MPEKSLYSSYTLPEQYPYITRTLPVHCLYITRTEPVHCLYNVCTVPVQHLYSASTLTLQCLSALPLPLRLLLGVCYISFSLLSLANGVGNESIEIKDERLLRLIRCHV